MYIQTLLDNITYFSIAVGKTIDFTYSADGNKLRKVGKTGAPINLVQFEDPVSNEMSIGEYVNGIEYRGTAIPANTIEAAYHAEGRVYNSAGSWKREYTIKDHLGNTRLAYCDLDNNGVVATPSEILQENHTDAFGYDLGGVYMNHANADNLYQYNGKEKNDDHGIGLYDYGARWYDAGIGRWTSVDLLAELAPDLTPYRYAFNNPILYFDLDGMFESKAAAQDYAKENNIKTGLFRSNHIVKQTDGTYAIENKKEGSSISDYGGDLGVLKGSLVSVTDILKSEVVGDKFGGIASRLEFRDGSSRVTSIFGPLDVIGGIGKVNTGKGALSVLDDLPSLDRTGKIHTNLSSGLPKVKDLGRYSVDDLSKFLKDLKISVKNRIKSTNLKGPNASRLQNRAHGQRQGAEQDLIKAVEKHLEDR